MTARTGAAGREGREGPPGPGAQAGAVSRTARTGAAALALLVVASLLGPAPSRLQAQQAGNHLGSGVHFQGFSFGEGIGADAANLTLVPLAYSHRVNARLSADIYTGWARGAVEREGRRFLLQGPLDTRLRASWRAAPWSVVSLGVNLPTGKSAHSAQEAVVASVLATDMLGFREANWGTGFGLTTGVAATHRLGEWGLGAGASFRLAGEYSPQQETDLRYSPGSEARLRLGVDRNVGASGKLTGGLTVQRFATDQVDGRNLFQAGNRLRIDAGYNFRVGTSTWNAFAANLWRDHGDLTLDLIDGTGQVVGDTTFVTSSQNLFVLGVTGSVPVLPGYRFRPSADVRFQDRDEGAGSGWLMSVGGDVPVRLLGRYDVFPRAMLVLGRLEGPDDARSSVRGGEVGLTVRWRP